MWTFIWTIPDEEEGVSSGWSIGACRSRSTDYDSRTCRKRFDFSGVYKTGGKGHPHCKYYLFVSKTDRAHVPLDGHNDDTEYHIVL